jgi:hypothetical protein
VDLNDARKDPGDYWKIIMKDQPIPEEIKALFHGDPLHPADARKKDHYVKGFDVTPNAIIYHAHMEPKEEKPHFHARKKDHFVKNFDVTPNAIIYHAHMEPKEEKLHFHGDPLNTADLRKKNQFVKDFDVTPNAIIYHAHMEPKEEKPHVKDFEPKHDMELKEEDSFVQHIKQKVEG